MPAKNGISVALSDEAYNAVKAYAKAKGISLSKTVAILIHEISPQLLNVSHAIELAKSHIEHNDNKLHDCLQDLISQVSLQANQLSQTDLNAILGGKNEN